MNDRRRKFKTLAEGRTNSALTMIRKIGKLNNRAAYDFTSSEVEQICKALEDEVAALRTRFASDWRKPVFRLDKAAE